MIVLDASIVIKWFQPESDSAEALKFEEQHVAGQNSIAAPDLLFYEITNVLRYQKQITLEAIDEALNALGGMEIQTFTFSPEELKEVTRFARAYEISGYDALYAVLAQRLGCGFVTADKKLYSNLKKFRWISLL